MSQNKITRRDFIRTTAAVTLSSAIMPPFLAEAFSKETVAAAKRVKVILIRDANAVDSQGNVNTEIIQQMLDTAVAALFDTKDVSNAWKSIIQPTDIVGIKSNVWKNIPTPKELEHAIYTRVKEIGVSGKNISIDDRGVLKNPIFQNSTALINVRPLRTHYWAGIGSCIKNYIMFTPTPWEYHTDACSDLAAIWQFPIVKGKTRLNILSALTPQFYGRGPHGFDKRYVWNYNGLLVSTDPVAVDTVGARILQLKRIAYFGEDKPMETTPKHIEVADKKYRLGISDLTQIELVKLGWKNDILI
ncbi:MAG: DUF362 domain-containing protein [bacterium]|nr:DUF362 domain-containing protein [bacterium]